MAIFLEIIGAVVLIFVGLIATMVFFIKWKLRKMTQLLKAVGSPLIPIHARIEHTEKIRWIEPNTVRRYCRDLEKAGFREIGSYSIRRMRGAKMLAFLNEELQVYATVSQFAVLKKTWVNLRQDTIDNRELSVTNSEERNTASPEWKTVIRKTGAEIDELLTLLKENRLEGEVMPVSSDAFLMTFEDSYFRSAKWNYEFNKMPIPNIAFLERKFKIKPDEETVTFLRELSRQGKWDQRVREAYREAKSCSLEDCSDLFFVHDKLLPDQVSDMVLDDYRENFDVADIIATIPGKNPREVFARLIRSLKIDDRFEKIQEFEEPFGFAVYARTTPKT